MTAAVAGGPASGARMGWSCAPAMLASATVLGTAQHERHRDTKRAYQSRIAWVTEAEPWAAS